MAESMGDVVGRVARDDAATCCCIGLAVGIRVGTFDVVLGSAGSSTDDGVGGLLFFLLAIETNSKTT